MLRSVSRKLCVSFGQLSQASSRPLINHARVVRISLSSLKLEQNKDNKSFFAIQEAGTTAAADSEVDVVFKSLYDKLSNNTLEDLTERFDEIGEQLDDAQSHEFDVTYSSGVLTVKFGPSIGTYVLNKQVPNLQIWLSSPSSGPKRFDLIERQWVYKRTGETLHQLLTKEISSALKKEYVFKNHT